MPIEPRFCKQCERDFAKKTVKLNGVSVPASIHPPCAWGKMKISVNGYFYTVPAPTGWSGEEIKGAYDFVEGTASSKLNTLTSLLRCPTCGCWRHASRGLNLKCDNCGRVWRKQYPRRGRPPVSEQERTRIGSGTYRRKSKDIRWR